MLKYALHYLQMGWSVIPVNKEKQPLIPTWTEFQRRRPTEDEVRKWWSQSPNADIAVITGKVSGLVVVDVDSDKGAENLRNHVKGDPTDTDDFTLVSQTGRGGYHIFYKHPGTEVPCSVGVLEDVDIRGDGGYVVVYPSVHKNGNQYKWLTQVMPTPMPTSIHTLALSRKHAKLEPEDWSSEIPDGQRDSELTRRVGKLLAIGIVPGEVLSMMKVWNQEHCVPPLPETDVARIVDSIARKEKAKRPTPAKASGGEQAPRQFLVHSFQDTVHKYGYEEVTWTIDEWLPDRTLALTVAPPGTFKTWLLLSLAVAVSTGKPFLGHYPVSNPGPVIIIQQEDPFPMLFERLASIMNIGDVIRDGDEWQVPWPPDFPEIYWHTDRMLNFKDKNSVEGLCKVVEEIRPKLVIIDPLYSAVDMKDYMAESAQDMLELKRLRDEYGCSFFIAHHTTKRHGEGGRERDDLWGSQFLNAWLETGWQVRSKIDGQAVTVKRHFKHSAHPKMIRLDLHITPSSFRVDISEEKANEQMDQKEQLADLLDSGQITSMGQAADLLGLQGKGTISRMFKDMGVEKREDGTYRIGKG